MTVTHGTPLDRRLPTPAARLRTPLAVATGILVALLHVNAGRGFGAGLDDGWGEVLQWGVTHAAQWGKDLIFTYGPLGFATPGLPFDPRTYPSAILIQQAMALASACLVVSCLRRMSLAIGVSYLLAELAFGGLPYNWATLFIVYPLSMVELERWSRGAALGRPSDHLRIAALAAYAAVLPLMKFSTFPLWLAWLPLAVLVLWRARTGVLVVSFLGASFGAPVLVWVACDQRLANIPRFLRTSWEVAVKYSDAMQIEPQPAWLAPWVDSLAVGAALACAGLTVAFALRVRHSARRLAICAVVIATTTIAYRAGVVRADAVHLLPYFALCAWCGILLIGLLQQECPLRVPVRGAVRVLPLASLTLLVAVSATPRLREFTGYGGIKAPAYCFERIADLVHPLHAYAMRGSQWYADRATLALPEISQTVGGETIDALMYPQSWLLANDLNYKPRPIFQSYSAYSDRLARLNEDFFATADAPGWVMMKWATIDNRYPTSDDSRALVQMLQDYRPWLVERGFLLLRHRGVAGKALRGTSALPVGIGFDTYSPVPSSTAGAWFATIDVHLTMFGKLRAILLRAPELHIDVTLRDGSHERYRLVRSIAHSGFMLSPALASNRQLIEWWQGDSAREVVAARLAQQEFLGQPVFRMVHSANLYSLALPRFPEAQPWRALTSSQGLRTPIRQHTVGPSILANATR